MTFFSQIQNNLGHVTHTHITQIDITQIYSIQIHTTQIHSTEILRMIASENVQKRCIYI